MPASMAAVLQSLAPALEVQVRWLKLSEVLFNYSQGTYDEDKPRYEHAIHFGERRRKRPSHRKSRCGTNNFSWVVERTSKF